MLMFLHYLGKHKHEPRKLCFFSHPVYRVLKTTLLCHMACYIVDVRQPILIFFADNKFVLLSTVCKYYFSSSLAISFPRHGM